MRVRFFILFLVSFSASAQLTLTDREYYFKYKKAVQLYADGQYLEAQNELIPLTLRKYNNSMGPYVHYYHALSSFKLKKYYDTRSMLRQLNERYPDWKQIDESYYLYGNACLADNYFDEGIDNLDKITDNSLKKDAQNLQYFYLKPIKDIALLRQLNFRHSGSKLIAEILVNVIQANKHPTRDDLQLSDRLTNQFNLGSNLATKRTNSPAQSTQFANDIQKDYLNVAILLPFRLNLFDPDKRTRSNQYIFDMYEGMKLAKEKLANERITLNLFAFDIDKNADQMYELVNNSNFGKMDMFIGPLYPEVNYIATNFAQDKTIVQVHPLSNNSQLIQHEPLTYLAMPSYEMQAKKSIEFILSKNLKGTVAIYYGSSRKDSTFAYIYRDKAIEKGLKIAALKRYYSDNDIDGQMHPDHVFIAGSEANIGVKIISVLDRKKINTTIIATSAAFNFETTPLSIFNRSLFLIQPDFIDDTKEEVKNFKTDYINEMNMTPSYYSYWGYDTMLFFGRMLSVGKRNFRNEINTNEFTQGYTLGGFDYTKNLNENQIVPIVKYQEGKFVEVTK